MKQIRLFLLISTLVGGVWAQTPGAQTPATEAALEQRRAELRSVLRAHGRELQQGDHALETVSLNRHLSAQELADLRQQLRQQHRQARLERP